MDKKPSKTWEAGAFDREKNEWVHTTLHSYDHTSEVTPDMFVNQAPRISVHPSRRKQPKREGHHVLMGIGDIHFPFHDKKRLDLAQTALQVRSPDTIVLMGDNLDNAMFSRFETRQEWVNSTQRGIDQFAAFMGQLRSDHPKTRIVWHEGNHDQRIEKQIRQYNGELLGLRRAGEKLGALSLEFLLHTEELGIEFVGGYPTSRTLHEGVLETYHGSITRSNGLAASKVIESAFVSFMTGHTHQLGMVSKTFHDGKSPRTIYGVEAGTYASPDLIPSGKYANGHTQRHNWQSGVPEWVLTTHDAVPIIHPIDRWGLHIDGRTYR